MPLVRDLFDGPIDIVGDIHGEAGQLNQLLLCLGYDGAGQHPEGRHLVFVGDLVDRGPDSPSVVRVVRGLVESGAAQMVLGNHEVNLMRRAKKHGNHWFWGEAEQLCNASPDASRPVLDPDVPSEAVLEDPARQEDYIAFLNTIPVALERPGITVVHAMYHKASLDALRYFESNAAEAREEFDRRIQAKLATLQAEGRAPTGDELEMMLQNDNPISVLTTGMEVRASEPFFAGGKMRTLQRYRWWEDYDGGSGLVVIGHYWRRRPMSVDLGVELTGTCLFPSEEARPGAELTSLGFSMTPDGSVDGPVVCVDYSVGLRYEERGRGLPQGSLGTALAALRLPERTLHFADGEIAPLASPG